MSHIKKKHCDGRIDKIPQEGQMITESAPCRTITQSSVSYSVIQFGSSLMSRARIFVTLLNLPRVDSYSDMRCTDGFNSVIEQRPQLLSEWILEIYSTVLRVCTACRVETSILIKPSGA
jgi:hypothetical protein